MRLETYRHLWGVTEPWEVAVPHFKTLGYCGIEAYLTTPEARTKVKFLLEQHNLKFIAQILTFGEDQLKQFETQFQAALELRPSMINAHVGMDAWNDTDTLKLYARVLEIAAEAKIPIAFETHRGRATFTPWRTVWLLEQLPQMRLVCDLSHWVCVCERLLGDQHAAIESAARACAHIHARVGFEQGPQVPDPRDPMWQAQLEAHEAWWHLIWQAQQARGEITSTLTPEFGPPNYQHTQPYTQMPVAHLAEICEWMASRQRRNFESSVTKEFI